MTSSLKNENFVQPRSQGPLSSYLEKEKRVDPGNEVEFCLGSFQCQWGRVSGITEKCMRLIIRHVGLRSCITSTRYQENKTLYFVQSLQNLGFQNGSFSERSPDQLYSRSCSCEKWKRFVDWHRCVMLIFKNRVLDKDAQVWLGSTAANGSL